MGHLEAATQALVHLSPKAVRVPEDVALNTIEHLVFAPNNALRITQWAKEDAAMKQTLMTWARNYQRQVYIEQRDRRNVSAAGLLTLCAIPVAMMTNRAADVLLSGPLMWPAIIIPCLLIQYGASSVERGREVAIATFVTEELQ
jgi:hypothetical protein